MTKTCLALVLVGALTLPQAAWAQSRTTLGVGSGAVAGALVAGPIGAVAGAVVGGLVGSSTEGGRQRHLRRVRRYAAPVRRERRAQADLPRTTGSVAAGSPTTAWKNPR